MELKISSLSSPSLMPLEGLLAQADREENLLAPADREENLLAPADRVENLLAPAVGVENLLAQADREVQEPGPFPQVEE